MLFLVAESRTRRYFQGRVPTSSLTFHFRAFRVITLVSASTMARVTEGSFLSESHGGVRIRTKSWVPQNSTNRGDRLVSNVAIPPAGIVLWSHGLHEHLGRFEHLYEQLVSQNIAVHTWDHVGHGESGACGAKRHQIDKGFDAVVGDGVQFARSVRSNYPPSVPLFMGGVSFGGLVAAHTSHELKKYGISVAGTILVAPCIDVEWTALLKFQASIGSFLAKVTPHVRGAAAVTPDRLSSDQSAIKEYVDDPLVRVANVRFLAAYEILKGFRLLNEKKTQFNLPLLVIHGTNDAACFYPASEQFVRDVSSLDKKFVSVQNGSHLLLHDSATKQNTVDEVLTFVVARAAAAKAQQMGNSSSLNAHTERGSSGSGHVFSIASATGSVPVTEAMEHDIGSRL